MIRPSSCQTDSTALSRDMAAIAAALSAVRVPAQPEEYDIHAAARAALTEER